MEQTDDYQEHHLTQLDRFLGLWEKLQLGERNILLVFMQRLYNGQKKFGPIDRAKRLWTYEALEEALDASVYLAAALEARAYEAYESSVEQEEAEVALEKASERGLP